MNQQIKNAKKKWFLRILITIFSYYVPLGSQKYKGISIY